MTPHDIRIGTRLELELLNNNSEKIGNSHISQLLEHHGNRTMVISAPIFKGRLIFIPLHMRLRFTFMQRNYGLFSFTAIVTGRELRGNIAVVFVRPEGQLVKIQRRTHYRLDCIANVLIWTTGKDPNVESKTAIKAFTKNVSGSGVCVISTVDVPQRSMVDIELSLMDNIIINAKCIVARNIEFEVRNIKTYELGLHFVTISQKDQDSLIKYIFEKQRAQRKR